MHAHLYSARFLSGRILVFVISCLLSQVLAAQSLVQDEARILSGEVSRVLNSRLSECKKSTGVNVYALTLAKLEDQPLARAQAMLQHESASEPALVVAFAWGMQQPLLLPNSILTERYSVRDLTLLLVKVRDLFVLTDGTLSQKFDASTLALGEGLNGLEQARQQDSVRHFPMDLFVSLSAVLLGAALLLGVGLLWLQAGSARPRPKYFPDVHVGSRLGAPYGGGTMGSSETGRKER